MSTSSTRQTTLLSRLRQLAADLSGRPADELVSGASFPELGLDSLVLTQLAQAFQREFGVRVTFRQLLDELPTLDAVARHLDTTLPPEAAPAPATVAMSPAATLAPVVSGPVPALAGAAAPGSVQAVVLQQLALMQQQLQLLRGGKLAGDVAATMAAVAALAAQPAGATPAAAVPTAGAAPAATPEAPRSPEPVGSVKAPRTAADRALTPHQQRRLDALVARYAARTAKSKAMVQAQRRVHADPRTASGFNRRWKEMNYPIVVERSLGSKLWDVDGNEYVDLLNGFGPNFLGHSPPFIAEAIRAQLERGIEVGPSTPLAGEVAQLVCELTGMERASLVCTGSEAVAASIRLARTVTGRDKVVVFTRDYHGNFDEVLVRAANTPARLRTLPSAPGIPFRAVDDVIVLDYGTEESLEIIRKHADELAAVIVEPVQSRRPEWQPREFLHALRAITADHGVVLVFDEVVTGFRCHQGGAQAYFGVEADLATYGKVVGGGMPIGIVAGRARFMDTFDGGWWQFGDDSHPEAGVTFFAGTFVRHPLAVAATHAMLTYLKSAGPGLQERLNETTTGFATKVNALLREHDLPFTLPHFGSQLFLRHTDDDELGSLLFHYLRLKGVHILEGFPSYLTVSHSPEDLDRVVRAFGESVEEMLEAGFFRRRAKAEAAAPRPGEPPVPGARLGRDPDGTPAWYVPDPARPSKYLRVGAAR